MEIEQPINDKVKEYCHYCVCKSCEDVQRLQAENAKLNAIIDGYQPRLQALKVEIAELQAYKDVNEDFKTAWEELKAENERLKISERDLNRICQGLKKYIETEKSYTLKYHKTLQEIKQLKAEIKLLKSTMKQENYVRTFEENEKLKQTLQEIKEIAENTYEMCAICGNAKYFKKIIDIINKAEVE